jgi:hypothetical protein
MSKLNELPTKDGLFHLPTSFHPEIYRLLNQDLKHMTTDELIKHFLTRCEVEKRKWNIEVFVICGGKCGSTTLEKTFRHNGYATIRAHGLEEFKTRNLCGLNLHELLEWNVKHGLPSLVIDCYREPIERKISSFFHNMQRHAPDVKDVDELIKLFDGKFIYELENYHPINRVFDHFGIEHFTEFDVVKGYNEKVVGRMRYVKVRFCDIGNWNVILSRIAGKGIVMQNDNLTKNRGYYALYCEFKKKYGGNAEYMREYVENDVEYGIYANKSS